MAGETFPEFQAQAQRAILGIRLEVNGEHIYQYDRCELAWFADMCSVFLICGPHDLSTTIAIRHLVWQ